MGKKDELNKVRKEVFKERMEIYENKEVEEVEEEDGYDYEEQSIKILKTFNTLLKYRDENELPLLEYSTFEKFGNYLNDVLRD